MLVKLKDRLKAEFEKGSGNGRKGTHVPPRCSKCTAFMPPTPVYELAGDRVCRVCHHASNPQPHRVCARCRVEKDLTPTYYYRKVRGGGHMKVCRSCRDTQLRRCNQRICRVCWQPLRGNSFTMKQWTSPQHDMAICIKCATDKRRKVPFPKEGERLCPRCNLIKQHGLFYALGNRISSYCKSCLKEYNRERHRAGADSGEFTNRVLRTLWHLERNFTSQELVDLWAEGEIPEAPDKVPVPKENFEVIKTRELNKFMEGFERGLGMGDGDESKSKEKRREQEGKDPPFKKRRVRVKVRLRR